MNESAHTFNPNSTVQFAQLVNKVKFACLHEENDKRLYVGGRPCAILPCYRYIAFEKWINWPIVNDCNLEKCSYVIQFMNAAVNE